MIESNKSPAVPLSSRCSSVIIVSFMSAPGKEIYTRIFTKGNIQLLEQLKKLAFKGYLPGYLEILGAETQTN